MLPPNVTFSRMLCILDLSWWLSRAWYVALNKAIGKADPVTATARQHQIAANDTVAMVTGWLVRFLSAPAPACVAVALDSMGPTWRHARTDELPAERRYKAGRAERPSAYHRASNTVIEIVQAHAIPILSAEGHEADDCIAAAVRLATGAGLDCAIISADKDFGALVRWPTGNRYDHENLDSHDGPWCNTCGDVHEPGTGGAGGVWQWPWNGSDDPELARDPITIEAKYGVSPAMMADWLAIVGDESDNVKGAAGVGEEWAAKILRAQARCFVGSEVAPLDGAFAMVPDERGDDVLAAARYALKKVEREVPNPFDDASVSRIEERRAEAQARLDDIKERRGLSRALKKLREQRDQVLLARELVTLDASCPIVWRPEELPVGGFDLERVRELYRELGFYGLAAEVRSEPKRSLDEIWGDRKEGTKNERWRRSSPASAAGSPGRTS